jgi:hypothetical protein
MVAFQYRFVTTVEDLLDADATARAHLPWRLFRGLIESARQLERVQLWVIGGFLAVGLIIFMLSSTRNDMLAVACLTCAIPLYYFVVAPIRARKRIRSRATPRQTIQLAFDKDGVSLSEEGTGAIRKTWDEFRGAAETRRGVLLYFGKAKMWIPKRAFDSEAERLEFVKFVKQFEPGDTPP